MKNLTIREVIVLLSKAPDLDRPAYVLHNGSGEPLTIRDVDFKDNPRWADFSECSGQEDCYPLIIVEE